MLQDCGQHSHGSIAWLHQLMPQARCIIIYKYICFQNLTPNTDTHAHRHTHACTLMQAHTHTHTPATMRPTSYQFSSHPER